MDGQTYLSHHITTVYMKSEVAHLHKDIVTIKNDVELIKNILVYEGTLTDGAKRRLKEARNTPEEEYVSLDAI